MENDTRPRKRSRAEDRVDDPHDPSGHDPRGFESSLTGVSEHTRRAYTHDVDEFVAWCERGGCRIASELDHRRCAATSPICRRAGFGKATISRKAASVHAYVRYLRRHGVVDARHRGAPAHRTRRRRSCRASRAATTRSRCSTRSADEDHDSTIRAPARRRACSSCSTAPACASSECCGLDVDSVDLRRATVTVLGKGSKVRRLPLGEPACDAVADYLRRTPGRAGHETPRPRSS